MGPSFRPSLLLAALIGFLAFLAWLLWAPPEPESPRGDESAQASSLDAGEEMPGGLDPATPEVPGSAGLERDPLGPSSMAQDLGAAADPDRAGIPVQVVDEMDRPYVGLSWSAWVRSEAGMGARMQRPVGGVPVASGRADADGRFLLPTTVLPPALGRLAVQTGLVDLELMLRHPETADARPASMVPSEGTWVIRLPRLTDAVHGRLLDPAGQPAVRAEIRVDGTYRGWTGPAGEFRLALDLEREGPPPRLLFLHASGSLDLEVDRPDLGSLRLQTGLALGGRVVGPDGIGLPGLRLRLVRQVVPGDGGGPFVPAAQRTADDGSFRFLGLPPGSYQLRAALDGMAGPLPQHLPLTLDGRPLEPLAAGQEGLRLETAMRLIQVHLDWPAEAAMRPRWLGWSWVDAGAPEQPLSKRYLQPPPLIQQVHLPPVPDEGTTLELRLEAEGFLPLRVPVALTAETRRYRLDLAPEPRDDVGSLRLDLELPQQARGWAVPFRIAPLDGQELPERLTKLALPTLDPLRQPSLLLDLPLGRYQVVLDPAGDGGLAPPSLEFAGDGIVAVEAGRLLLYRIRLEVSGAAPPEAPSDH
jgi:hypothetical protein